MNIIAAVAANGVIGNAGRLPWHIPEDLKRFKEMTKGDIVLMGRKTYESIGKPLPGRKNWVVTRDPSIWLDGVTRWRNLDTALEVAKDMKETVWVIGGGSLLEAALPFAEEVCITWIDKEVEGDAFFSVSEMLLFSKNLKPVFYERLTDDALFVVYKRKKND